MFVLDQCKHCVSYVHLIQVDVEVHVYHFDISLEILRIGFAIEMLFDLLRCIRCVIYLIDFVFHLDCLLRFGKNTVLAMDQSSQDFARSESH
jgi:hypothetical protein